MLIAVGQLVAWGTLYYSYALLAPAIAADLDVAAEVVALAFSATLLVAGMLAPMVGRWLDGHGAVAVLRCGVVVGPTALLLLAAARGPLAMWSGFLLLGLAQALSLYEPAFRAAVEWFTDHRRRGRALLLITVVGGFASTVFVPATAALVRAHGWRAATAVLALILAVVTIPIATVLPRTVAGRAARVVPGSAARNPVQASHWLGLAFACPAFASAAVAVALVWLLVERGHGLPAAALIAGFAGAAQVPGRLVLSPLRTRLGTEVRVTGILAAKAIALLLVALGPDLLLAPAVLGAGALNGMLTLERPMVVAEWFGVERFGVVSGGLAGYSLAARAVAPLTVAAVAAAHSYRMAFLGVAIIVALGALAFGRAAMPYSTRSTSPNTRARGSTSSSSTASMARRSRGHDACCLAALTADQVKRSCSAESRGSKPRGTSNAKTGMSATSSRSGR